MRPASSLLLLSLGNSDARHRLNFRKAHAGRGLDDAEDASTVGTLEVSRLRFGSRSIHGLRSRARDPAATGSTESTVRSLRWRPLVVPGAFAYTRSWCALFRAFMCLTPRAARGGAGERTGARPNRLEDPYGARCTEEIRRRRAAQPSLARGQAL